MLIKFLLHSMIPIKQFHFGNQVLCVNLAFDRWLQVLCIEHYLMLHLLHTDSDYADNPDNWKSTSGYVFTYGGGTISWRLKLQGCTALSTTKAEYIAASEGQLRKWSGYIDSWLTFQPKYESTIQHQPYTVTHKAQSTSSEIRFIMLRRSILRCSTVYHHFRELVTEKKLEIRKIDTEVNIVDSLTKLLPRPMLRNTEIQLGTTTSNRARKSWMKKRIRKVKDWPGEMSGKGKVKRAGMSRG